MTAEPDLPINDAVPAPTKIEPGNLFLWNWRQMQVYAQACVAHATAPLQAEVEALRAEVERLREIVRPKREEECLTLDHWRIRAYYLEENWSRCSRACAVEQTKREAAEARAERLAEALEEIRSRSSINLAMHPDPSALTARLGDIRQIADSALLNGGKA